MLGNRSGELPRRDRARTPGRSPLPATFPSGTGEGRTATPAGTEKTQEGTRSGVRPRRSGEPQRPEPRPPHPPRALPAPVLPRPRGLPSAPCSTDGEKQKAGAPVLPAAPRFFAPALVLSPAGPPRRTGRLFPLRCDSGLRTLHASRKPPRPQATSRQGRGRGRGGQGAGGDVTGGGGPGEARSPPRLPVNPRGVLISGLGVAVGRALLQVAAVSRAAEAGVRQTKRGPKRSSNPSALAPQPSTEDSSGQRNDGAAH